MSSDHENDNVKKKRGGSLVWQLYKKLSSSKMKCLICMHEQRYLGNTANALRHLKVKHDIDARACGLNDPENVRRMKELCVSPRQLEQSISFIQGNDTYEDENSQHSIRKSTTRHKIPFDDEPEFDPYTDNECLVEMGEDSKNFVQSDVKKPSDKLNTSDSPTKQNDYSLEEKKIIAETEYYREKAAYFRIQKHLSLLQAKKAKYELQQLLDN
ncbi:uncharacterized protein LOC142222336 [Haematobia irritans]|uniref:uncharacterized protein LOC142222336 n=1 Tax=Haematobia irritans TaxID=7368 RepID=UPI003F50B253